VIEVQILKSAKNASTTEGLDKYSMLQYSLNSPSQNFNFSAFSNSDEKLNPNFA
jgi:hypothetical protein